MGHRTSRVAAIVAATAALAVPGVAAADGWGDHGPLRPGDLLVSGSVYRDADIQPGVTQLPPGCSAANCGTANSDGAYPYVFNNDLADGSFGVTSPLFLDELTPSGNMVGRLRVPTDQLVTSFSSKSEGALNLSTDGREVTFIDYAAQPREIDVSNSNTPGVIDPTNPVPGAYYRGVAVLSRSGRLGVTLTNAYSGNNGRAAILNSAADVFYTAGNAGNGANPQPAGVVAGAGAQILSPSSLPESAQTPGQPTPVGSFSVTQLGDKADKIGKDDNFRGMTIYDHVLYYTKGSGGNGVDTVYYVDTDHTCATSGPLKGTGLPDARTTLPTSAIPYDPSTVASTGLPSNMCILRGFNTQLAKTSTNSFPFGIWFANSRTLYVADEGNGTNTYSTTSGQYTSALPASNSGGLQKWVFDATAGAWKLAYTLTDGLNLGQPYTVPRYPVGFNTIDGQTLGPWAPANDGLRNITGRVNPDGTATIWGVTSTVSGSGDQGADPNSLVAVTDDPSAATPPSGEAFHTVVAPRYAHVVRGVSFTPGTGIRSGNDWRAQGRSRAALRRSWKGASGR